MGLVLDVLLSVLLVEVAVLLPLAARRLLARRTRSDVEYEAFLHPVGMESVYNSGLAAVDPDLDEDLSLYDSDFTGGLYAPD